MATKKVVAAKPKRATISIPKSTKEAVDNHFINLTTAHIMVAAGGNTAPIHYSKKAIVELLNQTGCVALRIYKAKDAAGNDAFVLTGVNKFYDDVYIKRKKGKNTPAKVLARTPEEDGAIDMGQTCPSGYGDSTAQQRVTFTATLLIQ